MAVKLIANYAKRLGLPGYSSHQFSVSVETELVDVSQAAEESANLYQLLQQAVDEQIQQTGFVPPKTYGMTNGSNGHSTNGNGAGHSANGNGNGYHRSNGNNAGISEKQLDLINKVVREHNLNKAEVEQMAVDMFGNGVRALTRMQGSQLIDSLFEQNSKNGNGRAQARNGRYQRQGARQ